jgi:SnoaL-like domain
MSDDAKFLKTLAAKEAIRELVLLYSRGVDRQDIELLKGLYTRDATDHHGRHFDGTADAYIEFLARSLPHLYVSGHFACNHLISVVDDDHAEGEVYAIAWHIIPDGKGGAVQDLAGVRYIDQYRRERGCWRFAKRVVSFDFRDLKPVPVPAGEKADRAADASYVTLSSRLFGRGPRA